MMLLRIVWIVSLELLEALVRLGLVKLLGRQWELLVLLRLVGVLLVMAVLVVILIRLLHINLIINNSVKSLIISLERITIPNFNLFIIFLFIILSTTPHLELCFD